MMVGDSDVRFRGKNYIPNNVLCLHPSFSSTLKCTFETHCADFFFAHCCRGSSASPGGHLKIRRGREGGGNEEEEEQEEEGMHQHTTGGADLRHIKVCV